MPVMAPMRRPRLRDTYSFPTVEPTSRMSEYQYYEFQAIDRPLDQAAQEALRSISSRARITATSFTNHYEWGISRATRANSWSAGSTSTSIWRIGARGA